MPPNNPKEVPTSHSEDFDAKGNPRMRRTMSDGTISFLSEAEYLEELKTQAEEKNNQ